MTSKQIYSGLFLIVAGVSALVANLFGFANFWFIWPLAMGLTMMVVPITDRPRRRRGTRLAGMWMLVTGVMGAVTTFTQIGWDRLWPLWLIAAGAAGFFTRNSWTSTEEATR